MIDVDKIEGPAFLACALINGDESVVDGGEEDGPDHELLEEFLNSLEDGWYIMSCGKEWFGQWHGIGMNVTNYIIHKIIIE